MPTRSKRLGAAPYNHAAPQRSRAGRIRSICRIGMSAALLGIVAALPVIAAPPGPPQLPPLMDPASQEHHVGKIVLLNLVTPDLAAAKTFYGGLFGWTFRDIPLGDTAFAQALLDGHPVAGLFQRPVKAGEHRQPAWLGFISTTDVDATTKLAVEHGAKLLFGPHDIPALGRDAVLADPQGAVFAVLASSSGDPPDVLAAPGDWIWASLITTTPDTDAAFYQTLFDYDVFELPADPGAQHLLLASGNYARASVNSLPGGVPNLHPHWLQFVRVGDAVATAAKVTALGGRVLVEPRVDRQGGKVAVVADPLGAPFGLLEWPENDGKQVTK
jgi:predicted enzyme related to lactoylglutathione lyase